MIELLKNVQELHKQRWTVELRWGYFHSEPHYMADIMKASTRYVDVSNISIEDAFNKAYRRLIQAKEME